MIDIHDLFNRYTIKPEVNQTTDEISVGTKIKLKNYSMYGDWERHKGQTAVVTGILKIQSRSGFDIEITWEDKTTSHTSQKYCIIEGR